MKFHGKRTVKDKDSYRSTTAVGAAASGATALGTLALGALALGAAAVGALAIGRLAVGKARVRSLEIEDLKIGNLTVAQNQAASGNKPAVARIWRGCTRPEVADEYQQYNYETGVKPLMEKALSVQALRQDGENATVFVTISYWESLEAMARFTGGDPKMIHHLPRDSEFLIELPETVEIFEITHSHGDPQLTS